MSEPSKTCCHCREAKPLDAFGRDRNRSDGLNPTCKECRKSRTTYAERLQRGSIRPTTWTQISATGKTRWKEAETGCWEWLLSTQTKGYGTVYFNGRVRTAHRAAWEAHNGPIPDQMHLHHVCENQLCVNPEHLVLLAPEDHAALH